MRRPLDRLNLVLAVGLMGFAVWAWSRLPDRIPTHFGLDGQADAWTHTSGFTWFVVPGIALTLVGGIGWLRGLIPRKPGWVNLPDRTRLTDLSEVARRPVLEMLSGFLAWVQTEILAIFALVQFGTYRTAMGGSGQGVMILVLLLAVLASPLLLVVFFLQLQGALARGKRLEAASGE